MPTVYQVASSVEVTTTGTGSYYFDVSEPGTVQPPPIDPADLDATATHEISVADALTLLSAWTVVGATTGVGNTPTSVTFDSSNTAAMDVLAGVVADALFDGDNMETVMSGAFNTAVVGDLGTAFVSEGGVFDDAFGDGSAMSGFLAANSKLKYKNDFDLDFSTSDIADAIAPKLSDTSLITQIDSANLAEYANSDNSIPSTGLPLLKGDSININIIITSGDVTLSPAAHTRDGKSGTNNAALGDTVTYSLTTPVVKKLALVIVLGNDSDVGKPFDFSGSSSGTTAKATTASA
jgi:hypothetical protein